MKSRALAGMLAIAGALSLPAQVTEFSLATSGPHHVVQGHSMFFLVQGKILKGVNEPGTIPSIAGLPASATAEFVNMIRFCCGTTLWSLEDANPIKITAASTTPAGQYTLTLAYKTPEGLQRSTVYTLVVDPVPALPVKNPFPPDVPLPSLAQYKTNMTVKGKLHCTPAELTPTWPFPPGTGPYEGFAWYYDGTRVYYQIADYTQDPATWNPCAILVRDWYKTYVNGTQGGLPGYEIFAQGLATSYQRTQDPLSLQAVNYLGAPGQANYAGWPNAAFVITWLLSREMSYGLEAAMTAQALGSPANPHLGENADILFGHFDQWFLSRNAAYIQPFMVALAAEALIAYWEVTRDPRVPATLLLAADSIWAQSWNPSCNCFVYYETDPATSLPCTAVTPGCPNGPTSLSTDLNLLIAPLYGWIYQQTGTVGYRDKGDQIFNAGVAGAYLDGGKQFSQNYRWSEKYLEWRVGTPAPTPPAIPLTVSCPTGKTLVFQQASATSGTIACK